LTSQPPLFDIVYEYQDAASATKKKGSIRYVREQLQQYGAHTLSSVELLTLVLCTGAGDTSMRTRMQTLFLDHGGLQELLRADFGEVSRELGSAMSVVDREADENSLFSGEMQKQHSCKQFLS
jgi:DNA repair protein RadC